MNKIKLLPGLSRATHKTAKTTCRTGAQTCKTLFLHKPIYKPASRPVVHKKSATRKNASGVKTLGWPRFNRLLWQRNYWERIVWDEMSYHRISAYIRNNPANWPEDRAMEYER